MGNELDYRVMLADWQAGDSKAGNAVFSLLHEDLRNIAAARLRDERGASLSTGDLVNESVMRLSEMDRIKWQSRPHLLALASRIMRQVLIDHARAKNADKREHERVTLCTGIGYEEQPIELMELEFLLKDLSDIDPQRADIVEMRYFGGMSTSDIAVVLGISESSVQRRWASTRTWLLARLKA